MISLSLRCGPDLCARLHVYQSQLTTQYIHLCSNINHLVMETHLLLQSPISTHCLRCAVGPRFTASAAAQNTFMPTWDAVQNVLAPGADRQKPVPNVHPPFEEWIVMNADPDRTRDLIEYGDAERAATTVHFRSDDKVRLFGTPGFIYYPTIEWQVCRGLPVERLMRMICPSTTAVLQALQACTLTCPDSARRWVAR